MIRVVESKQKDIRRWSMTIYIDSTYQKRKICDMVFWVIASFYIPRLKSNLNGSVVYATDCYLKGAGFDSRVMLGVSPHVKEVEDIGLTTQPRKRSKIYLAIPNQKGRP
jgi:hypothetical protein